MLRPLHKERTKGLSHARTHTARDEEAESGIQNTPMTWRMCCCVCCKYSVQYDFVLSVLYFIEFTDVALVPSVSLALRRMFFLCTSYLVSPRSVRYFLGGGRALMPPGNSPEPLFFPFSLALLLHAWSPRQGGDKATVRVGLWSWGEERRKKEENMQE